MLYRLVRPIFFLFDAETIHHRVMKFARLALLIGLTRALMRAVFRFRAPQLKQDVFGLTFENPVGLAAGFDKNAEYLKVLETFGFGAVEIGTVTGQGQVGNERPRLFRLADDQGLLNRMGFNNHGSEVIAGRLSRLKRFEGLLGVNIGKTKLVSLDEAVEDYVLSFQRLYGSADYFVVNVSSPNTPGLRELQNKDRLTELIGTLQKLNMDMARERREAPRPMLVKIAPDLSDDQLTDVVDVVRETRISGIVATNTTIAREGLETSNVEGLGAGGVSGKPVQSRSLEIIRYLHKLAPDIPIIGVGGIFNADDALAAMRAGATLVQVWTGFVYEGPSIVKNINRGLAQACRQNGWDSISEAVGSDVSATSI
jgi:dihydroorotate dehydrogenase